MKKKLSFLFYIIPFLLFMSFVKIDDNKLLSFTFFRISDKNYNSLNYKTYAFPYKAYTLKSKIIEKIKTGLKKKNNKIYVESFTLKPTDWIVIYKAEHYADLKNKQGKKHFSIKCFKVTSEDKIDKEIKKRLDYSFIKERYISHKIIYKAQPNKKVELSFLLKALKEFNNLFSDKEKKQYNKAVKSSYAGVRG